MKDAPWTLAERVGKRLYEAQAQLGPAYGIPVHELPWASLPQELKGLWIATAGELLDELGLVGLQVRLDPTGTVQITPEASRPTPELLGFTGEPCVHCDSVRTLRTGSCLTCQDCGGTSACG